MTLRHATVLILLAALALSGATATAAPVEVGAVLPFENQTHDPSLDWIGESFSEMLASDLGSSRLMMIDRRERAAAFDTLGIPNARILSMATIYKIAEVLDADKLITGKYEFADGLLTATATILDMRGPSLSQPFRESAPLADLLLLQSRLAWQIEKALHPDFPLSKEEYVADVRAPRLDVFENYLRGLLAGQKSLQIQYYRTAQRLDPNFTRPAFELGMIYFKDRDYKTSVSWLAKLQRNDPDYLEAQYFLGLGYLYIGEYEKSAAAFKLVEQDLPLNEVYTDLGIALARLNRPGATQYFEKAAQSEPGNPDYEFNLAYSYWKRGDCAAARPHFESALAAQDPPAWRALYVECLEKLGDKTAAGQQTAILRQKYPAWTHADPSKFNNLERVKNDYDGSSFRQLRRLAQLQEELKHARLTTSEHVQLHFERAQQYLTEGAERKAAEELQLVIDFDPQDAGAYRMLGDLHLRLGELNEAAKAAARAQQWEPTAEGHVLLARIYAAQNKLEDAQAQIAAALALDPGNTAAVSLREDLNARGPARQ